MTSPAPRLSRRRVWPWLVAALLAVAVLHGALWWAATTRLEQALESTVVRMRADGWTVSHGTPRRAGWPLAAALDVPDVSLAGPVGTIPGGVAWQTPLLRGEWRPLQPRQLLLQAFGTQRLRLGPTASAELTADALQAVLPLVAPGSPRQAMLTGTDVRLTGEGWTEAATIAALHVGLEEPGPVRSEGSGPVEAAPPRRSLHVAAEEITLPALPAGARWPLGPRIATLSLDAAATGPLHVPGGREGAEAWRAGGGAFRLERLALAWGPLNLTASATLGLDAALQPAGSGEIALTGYEATLDALVSTGVMNARGAIATKSVLALLARPGAGGGPARVEVPLTLKERVLSAGGFALTRLPPWNWP